MTEPPYIRLEESKEEPPSQQKRSSQQDYPPAYTENQQIDIQPSSPFIGREAHVQPDDHLAFAIFVLICCCLPLGIVAVIKSFEVGKLFRTGDYDGALESSRSARTWARRGLICGSVSLVLQVVIVIVYMAVIVPILRKKLNEMNSNGAMNDWY